MLREAGLMAGLLLAAPGGFLAAAREPGGRAVCPDRHAPEERRGDRHRPDRRRLPLRHRGVPPRRAALQLGHRPLHRRRLHGHRAQLPHRHAPG